MQRIISLIIKEIHQMRRDKRIVSTLIIAPIMQLLLLGYAATTDVKNISLGVCDLDKSTVSRDFVRSFVSSGYFTITNTVNEYDKVDKLLDNGNAQVVLVIPPEFGADVAAQKSAPVQMLADGSDGYTAGIAVGYASQIAGAYNQTVLQQNIKRSGVKPTIGSITNDTRVWYNPELLSKNYMIPGIIASILLIMVGIQTAMAIVRERELGTLEQIIVTPIKPWEMIIGKLIPSILMSFIDVVLIITVGKFWFDVPLNGSIVFLFGCGVIYLISALGIGLFVSTVSHSQQQAMMTMQFFIIIPFMYLSGYIFPIENMPKILQYVSYLIPLRYFLEIVRGVFLKGDGFINLWPSILGMFIIGTAMLSLAAMRFHKRLE